MADLHELVAGFADVAAVYDRGRPGYPPELARRIVEELGVGAGARVLDVGAGTGKLTRPLLDAGLDVVGLEPLPGMREALAVAVGSERALAGSAEAIPLPDASLDGAVCGDAFHWFDPDRAPAELARVLRPGAGVVVSWLDAAEPQPPWSADVVALLRPLWERSRHPGIVERRRAEALVADPAFAPVRRSSFAFSDTVDRDGLLAWFASFSVVGALPDGERAEILGRIADILDRSGVDVSARRWCADVWAARRL